MEKSDIAKFERIDFKDIVKMSEGLSKDEFLLKYSKLKDFPAAFAADQIYYHKKVLKKLPLFAEKNLLIIGKSFEQASSEATALYKCSKMKGRSIIDLTGGLGVDSIFLNENFNHSSYCELNPLVYELFISNTKKLGLEFSCINGDSIEFLETCESNKFDWIFIDPSRRVQGNRKTALSDCEPDVTALMALFFEKAENVCIKASPAYDISMAAEEIDGLNEIIVVSYHGECREVLLFCSRIKYNNVTLRSVIVDDNGASMSETSSDLNMIIEKCEALPLKKYFYVPDPVFFKTGHYNILANKLSLSFVNRTVGYLTGDSKIDDFPGKTYKVVSEIGWNRKRLNKYLKDLNIKNALIARRDFPLDPAGLRKMLGVSDGGNDYLFFTKNSEEKKVCIHCIKD